MPKYHVSKSIEIAKPLSDIKHHLQDFRNWQSWSPWLITEPSATLTFKGEQGLLNSSYSWEGELVGKGTMTLTKIAEQQLEYDLSFLKPFKSQATVNFVLKPIDEQTTQVSWQMDSKLPFFMAFFKKMITGMIGMDYQRGLAMLKSQLETNQVNSRLNLIGERPLETIYYIAISQSAQLADMGETWQKGTGKLEQIINKKHADIALGTPFGLYQKMDMHTTQTDFEICYPIDQATYKSLSKASLKKPLSIGVIENCKTYVVEHTGSYQHIGNAWSLAYNAARNNKTKIKRKPMGLELYLNNPENTPEEQLKTEVLLFVK